MEIDIYNLFSLLPQGAFLKSIYIKRESTNTWDLVSPLDWTSPNYGKAHEWSYGNGILVLFPPITNMGMITLT